MMEASRDIEIINKLGMHARAAAKFVKLASSFSSDIDIEKDSRRVNAKSIMGVMMLAASKGSTVTIHAKGSDAANSVNALEQLINDRFDEDE
jgi:phosphocarrier protein